MNRRRFIQLTAALPALGAVGCAPGAEYDVAALARPELLGVLGPGAVRAIGEAYRATGGETTTDSLRDAILDARPLAARLFGARHPVAALVRGDFAEGRTVVVRGWVLAATEARQCALFSLRPA